MIEHKNYLSYVLENNLAISKFMLDHSLIVLAMIAFKDKEIKSIFEKEFEEYEKFILEIIPFSYNKITKKFAESNILISDYTIALNDKTCELYKVQDNKEINNNCVNLILNAMTNDLDINQDDYLKIISFNKKSLNKLNNSLNILHHLKKELFDDKVQIFFSHNFIDHLIKETETFLYTLLFFEKDMNYTPTYVYSCNFYYNLFLKDHSVYIKEMTFPINFKHLSPLEECEKRIDEISTKFDDQISPTIIDDFNSTMIKTNQEFTLYNKSLIQNLIYNNYYASAIPLLNDHILRESNYINYQLETFKSLT